MATRLQLSETKHEGTLGVLHAVRTFARHGSEETGRLGERGSRGIFLSAPRDTLTKFCLHDGYPSDDEIPSSQIFHAQF